MKHPFIINNNCSGDVELYETFFEGSVGILKWNEPMTGYQIELKNTQGEKKNIFLLKHNKEWFDPPIFGHPQEDLELIKMVKNKIDKMGI